MHYRLGVGVKDATSGGALATRGMSVFAQGLFDRVRGGQDLCKKVLAEAATKAQ